jgi:hypothetical protein
MAKHRQPFANNDVIRLNEFTKSSEQRLWIAVLAKAFDDAFYSADEGAALEALRWIKHGRDFNMVCRMAGREGTYVKERMLNKVIEREAAIINNHVKIKEATNNILKKFGLGIMILLFLMSCSQSKKIDKVTWDPIKAMVRITFGQVK